MKSAITPASVLIVDDTPQNISLLNAALMDEYTIKIATGGQQAIDICLSMPIDIILLDVMMPEMDGFETCRRLKNNPLTASIPVIFVTARGEINDESMGFDCGAVDYITKPISPPIVLARVDTHLQLKKVRDYLKDQNAFLDAEVQQRTREVVAVQEVTILAMASLAETRDNDTGNHIRRTQFYVKALADKLRTHNRFRHLLDDDKTIDLLFKSAPLHDIGKVGIPDQILLKPGRFTPEEFEIMKTHTTLGRDAILAAERRLGLELPFLAYAKEIAYTHQEKWDGTGYPEGLSGDNIPISGRLMAVADVYDALICRRVYKEGMPHEKAVGIICESSGTHFDPACIDAFMAMWDDALRVRERFADPLPEI